MFLGYLLIYLQSNLKKFMEYVQTKNSEKVEKMCSQGLDPNYHDAQGETPLTLAAGVPNNRGVIVALVGGGAHIDFRNSEGQVRAPLLDGQETIDRFRQLCIRRHFCRRWKMPRP